MNLCTRPIKANAHVDVVVFEKAGLLFSYEHPIGFEGRTHAGMSDILQDGKSLWS
jgi:hypothetical protein